MILSISQYDYGYIYRRIESSVSDHSPPQYMSTMPAPTSCLFIEWLWQETPFN